MMTCIEQEGGN